MTPMALVNLCCNYCGKIGSFSFCDSNTLLLTMLMSTLLSYDKTSYQQHTVGKLFPIILSSPCQLRLPRQSFSFCDSNTLHLTMLMSTLLSYDKTSDQQHTVGKLFPIILSSPCQLGLLDMAELSIEEVGQWLKVVNNRTQPSVTLKHCANQIEHKHETHSNGHECSSIHPHSLFKLNTTIHGLYRWMHNYMQGVHGPVVHGLQCPSVFIYTLDPDDLNLLWPFLRRTVWPSSMCTANHTHACS